MGEADEVVWDVKEIIDSDRLKGEVQYRVRWVGCTELEDTWETIDHLDNYLEKLAGFRRKSLRKPRDGRDV